MGEGDTVRVRVTEMDDVRLTDLVRVNETEDVRVTDLVTEREGEAEVVTAATRTGFISNTPMKMVRRIAVLVVGRRDTRRPAGATAEHGDGVGR